MKVINNDYPRVLEHGFRTTSRDITLFHEQKIIFDDLSHQKSLLDVTIQGN
jgi:hypothetical protein